jgi:hypothetical protein
MSKITDMRRKDIRWKLLTTVSAAALLASAYGASEAVAAGNDSGRPLLWIELGGQLDRLGNSQGAFDPPFMASITKPSLLSALNVQNPPVYGLDLEGAISFQPDDSNWVFSASLRYGRANMARHRHQQTANAVVPFDITLPPPFATLFGTHYLKYGSYYPSQHVKFADGKSSESERHAILDFQAGKDVGLGMFSGRGYSVLSAGVRFAQFSSKENVRLRALPDLQYPTAPVVGSLFAALPARNAFLYATVHFHAYTGSANSERSFRGVGPSIDWKASMPFAGNSDGGELTFDWGANAAILFGHQGAKGHHQTTTQTYQKTGWCGGNRACGAGGGANHGGKFGRVAGHFGGGTQQSAFFGNLSYTNGAISRTHNAADFNRTRAVTVPNFGAFAGLSYRYADAKISLGYRADFFFGAMDGGIDSRKSENRGFFGPFASISVGLGD